MTLSSLTHAVAGWIAAHPVEAFIALGAVLNLINGLLPATIRTGPVGTALHIAIDRVTILTRRNAPGTLKWPIVAGSILRAVADSLNPPTPEAPPLPTLDLAEKAGAVAVSETRGAFDPQAHITRAQLPPFDSNRGYATVRALLAVVVTLAVVLPVGVALMGCPNWNRPACTTPGAYSCVAGQPRWCSTTGELTPVGDEPCERSGRVCVVEADGMASCVAPVDGGAQ